MASKFTVVVSTARVFNPTTERKLMALCLATSTVSSLEHDASANAATDTTNKFSCSLLLKTFNWLINNYLLIRSSKNECQFTCY